MTLMTFLVIFLITLEIFLITLMIFLIILNNIPNRMGALPCQQVLSVYSSVVSPASPSLPPPSIYIPCNCDLLAATQDTPYKLLWAGDKYLGWSSHLPPPSTGNVLWREEDLLCLTVQVQFLNQNMKNFFKTPIDCSPTNHALPKLGIISVQLFALCYQEI